MTTNSISQPALEAYLWGAATLLRGTIDAGDYKQFIFPLLFWKRLCDVYDEERARSQAELGDDFGEYHQFVIPRGAHWEDVRAYSSHIGLQIAAAMRAIEQLNPVLAGIFGDAAWSNTDRLSDAMLTDLIEHFSTQTLSKARVSEDLLGQAYEYLIKKFADDSGHTAAEFYTNRTVVHLMTHLLEPQEGESVYDPTCGSGGMLISAAEELRRRGRDTRTLRMAGQEVNLMTSAIARMNLFLHGFDDFEIVRGDTLAAPAFLDGDRLRQFDVILANPPYSISRWNRTAFAHDPHGRNRFGTPPQGRADYAFWQHILASLTPDRGRCAILFPHGVLFRAEEQHMRAPLVQADLIEAIIGLGPNLFYNSPMEACVIVCRARKPAERRGRILFINAVNEVTRERSFSALEDAHIERIVAAYRTFADEDGFARVATLNEIMSHDATLSIPLYVRPANGNGNADRRASLAEAIVEWQTSLLEVRTTFDNLTRDSSAVPEAPDSRRDTRSIDTAQLKHSAERNRELEERIMLQPDINEIRRSIAQTQRHLNAFPPEMLGRPPKEVLDAFNMAAMAHKQMIDPAFITGRFQRLVEQLPKYDERVFKDVVRHFQDLKAQQELWSTAVSASELPSYRFAVEVLRTMRTSFSTLQTVNAQYQTTVDANTEIRSYLETIAANRGEELREILGETDQVGIVADFLADVLPFDELPDNLKSGASYWKTGLANVAIPVAVVFSFILALLWLIADKGFGSASFLTQTLLTLLIYVKQEASADRSE